MKKSKKSLQVEQEPDPSINRDKLVQAVNNQHEREWCLYPLRIDAHTVIYVKKDKCTQEYAYKYREKIRCVSKEPLSENNLNEGQYE